MNPRALMRADLLALKIYPEAPTIADLEAELGIPVIKLDSNENPYGPSPLVAEALRQTCAERYPDANCRVLRAELGRYLGVDPTRIVCGVGGDEVIDLLLRLFLEPGDEVIDCTPSFVMYPLFTTYNRGVLVAVPRTASFAVDLAAIERALTPRTKVIIVCNPNNPTGNLSPDADIVSLLETGRVVILDEAYAEFSGHTLINLGDRYPNLVVLRTMSKWAALAGIRLGYAVADPAVIAEANKIRSPYNVSAAAQVAGIASLQDRDYLLANVRTIIAERERLYSRLAGLPFGTVYPSETNFLYWTTGGPPAQALKGALRRRGVLVRAFEQPVEALRYSVGTPPESDRLCQALEESYAELAG